VRSSRRQSMAVSGVLAAAAAMDAAHRTRCGTPLMGENIEL
jgi:ribose/xylose/arabinose/galactoside ABC-type transport system permease subunit